MQSINFKQISEDKKRLLGNFFSLSVLQIFTYILPLLTMPYLVKVLGIEKFGLVAFAQSFMAFFTIFVDYGFNLSATREIAISREKAYKTEKIYSAIMQIKLILLLFSFIVLNIIIFSFGKFSSHITLYYIAFIAVIGQAFFPIWFFQGMERMKYITIINISTKILFTIAIFIFIHKSEDYIFVPLLNGLGILSGSLISLYIIHNSFKHKITKQKLITLYFYFKSSSQFFLSRVSVSVYTSANAFVLGLFTNTTMVGYYSVAEKLYQALLGLYSPLLQALYPYMSKHKNMTMYKKIFLAVILVNLSAVLFIYLFHGLILELLFSTNNTEINKIFLILISSSILHLPAILLGYPLLAAFGFPKYANLTVVQSSIVHIVGLGSLALTNNINIYSVSIMVAITEATVFLTRLYYAKKMNLIFKRL